MKGLSVLIFSKGYVDNIITVVRDVYGIADDIVLFDASNRREHERLKRIKASSGLPKLRIFPMIALGYPDPLRMYGLGKCRRDWVLLIDTDELLSRGLKDRMHQLVSGKRSAFALRRYEEVKSVESMPLFSTWQVRLFKKDSVEFRGLPHEQPIVRGKLERLDESGCCMMHMSGMMSRKTQLDYGEMEKFERLTYKMYRAKMLEYASKLGTNEDKNSNKTLSGRIISSWIWFYQHVTLKKDEEELSGFDYFMYYSMLDLAYYTLEGNMKGIFGIIPNERRHVDQINRWRSEKGGERILKISKIINSIGITKFLELDNESVVDNLIKRYKYKDGGIGLLFKLINDRYDKLKDGAIDGG
ncbi:MAG: hypothetical protein ACREBH_00245 [Candidatus Micrarchaeaceae archaeon]